MYTPKQIYAFGKRKKVKKKVSHLPTLIFSGCNLNCTYFFYLALIPIKCHNHRLKSTQDFHASVLIRCHSLKSQPYLIFLVKPNFLKFFCENISKHRCLHTSDHFGQNSEANAQYLTIVCLKAQVNMLCTRTNFL